MYYEKWNKLAKFSHVFSNILLAIDFLFKLKKSSTLSKNSILDLLPMCRKSAILLLSWLSRRARMKMTSQDNKNNLFIQHNLAPAAWRLGKPLYTYIDSLCIA